MLLGSINMQHDDLSVFFLHAESRGHASLVQCSTPASWLDLHTMCHTSNHGSLGPAGISLVPAGTVQYHMQRNDAQRNAARACV